MHETNTPHSSQIPHHLMLNKHCLENHQTPHPPLPPNNTQNGSNFQTLQGQEGPFTLHFWGVSLEKTAFIKR
jgi:hypothetical protein